MTQALSPLETVKQSINPYAGREVFARLATGAVEDITPEDDVVMRWHGMYTHRPQGSGQFMLRLKLPGGAITVPQLETVAAIADQFCQGMVSLTTRQSIEFHRLTLSVLPEVFDALAAAGLTTVGACGDQVRGVVACPVAGLDPDELLDTAPTAKALTTAFLANPAFANLPRKFKIAISGCGRHCVPTEINDMGLVAAQNQQGEMGYALLVGGGLSVKPVMATSLDVWISPDEAVEVVTRAVEIFREYGNREQRGQARVKHLIAERGLTWFRNELFTRLGRVLPDLDGRDLWPTSRLDHLGVNRQKGEGLAYIGIPVPVGRLSTEQLRVLAQLASVDSQLRVTYQQNIVLSDIPEAEVESALAALDACGLPVNEHSWQGRTVACIGKAFCNKAISHTKEIAVRVAAVLDELAPNVPISLRMSGCPNGCGQHAIADIGLSGVATKGDDGPEERFDLWVGGGVSGTTPAFARKIHVKLHPAELPTIISGLVSQYQREAYPGETFSAYAQRVLWEGSRTDK